MLQLQAPVRRAVGSLAGAAVTAVLIAGATVAVSLFQMGFGILSDLLGMLTANRVTRELGARIFFANSGLRHSSIRDFIRLSDDEEHDDRR